jgi:hypothetical protein
VDVGTGEGVRELVGVGDADHVGAGVPQRRHDGSVAALRRRVRQPGRVAAADAVAGDRDEVLDRDPQAVQRPAPGRRGEHAGRPGRHAPHRVARRLRNLDATAHSATRLGVTRHGLTRHSGSLGWDRVID